MRSQVLCVVVSGVAALVLTACGGGGGDGGSNGGSTTPTAVTLVAGNNQTAAAGTELPTALSVSVTNASGQPVAGVTVAWAVTAGGGSLAPASSMTSAAGTASTRWTLGPAAGANRATATVAGIPAVTFDATATAVSGTTASVTVTSPTVRPYEGDTVQLTAVAKDQAGNVLAGKVASWSSSDPVLAPVSTTGLLNTWRTGQVTVTATIDGVTGQLALTLTPILATVTLGAREIVIDWTTDRCEDLDVPDGPARFVRAQDNSLVLFSGNAPRYYVSRGAGFGSLARDCSQSVLVSKDLPTAESYENYEWPWAIYRDGASWHALVHNEFHDPVAATCQPGNSAPGNPCWYNSITHAVSTDGAKTFTKPLAPAHVVAPAPNAWVAPLPGEVPVGNGTVEGYFNPSNIVHASDGYYYSFLMAIPTRNWTEAQGLCAFRTNTLADPSSWRAWDGSGFNLRMTSPYVTGSPATVCSFLDTVMTQGQVEYNTYLERYMYVSVSQGPYDVAGRMVCGFFYALSADLVHWSRHQLLVEAQLPWCPADLQQPGVLDPQTVLYPSIVDHADTTVNFERTGRTPYLYYTRFNVGLDRDLVRVPLTITRQN
jgi:hypothetical protein